jgi:hypothetical protein
MPPNPTPMITLANGSVWWKAGIADEAFCGVSFGHILCKPHPIDRAGKENLKS